MPETKIYTLYVPGEKATANTNTDTSIAIHIDSEQYLKQPYIAYRNSLYQLEISRYSKWESSPNRMVKNEFKDALSSNGVFKNVRAANITPEGFYSLKINLKQFERFDTEKDFFGILAFDIAFLSPYDEELYHSTISKKVKLDNRSFSSLAQGLSIALKEGIEEVSFQIINAVNAPNKR